MLKLIQLFLRGFVLQQESLDTLAIPIHGDHFIFNQALQNNNLSNIVFNRTSRIWNSLAADLGLSVACSLSSFKAVLYGFKKQALVASYFPDDPRSFKSICLTCNAAHKLGRNIVCCL